MSAQTSSNNIDKSIINIKFMPTNEVMRNGNKNGK